MAHFKLRTSALICSVATALLSCHSAVAGIQKEIRFAKGASGALLEGSVVRGERDRYLLGANAGQYLSLKVESLEDNAVVDVYFPGAQGADETNIKGITVPGGKEATSVVLKLSATGQYLLVVGGSRGNAQYRLTVSVTAKPPENNPDNNRLYPATSGDAPIVPSKKAAAADDRTLTIDSFVGQVVRCRPNDSVMFIYYFHPDRTISAFTYAVDKDKVNPITGMFGKYWFTGQNLVDIQMFGTWSYPNEINFPKAPKRQSSSLKRVSQSDAMLDNDRCEVLATSITPGVEAMHEKFRRQLGF